MARYHRHSSLTGDFFIDEEYATSVPVTYRWIRDGKEGSILGNVDHPSFAALRDCLEGDGYIKTQRTCRNGDKVLKHFRVNDILFHPGDRFLSAAAFGAKLKFNNK
jgi:hypothetical protein